MFELLRTLERPLIATQLLLAMFGMGATLRLGDFAEVVKRPFGVLLGLTMQLIFVPAVAMLFIHIFGMGDGWAVGLILVSAVPGGAFSNLLTFLGRGNVPLSIAVTTVSTLSCIVTVPTLLGVLASAQLPADFEFPALQVIRDILAFLMLPLAVGMVVCWRKPKLAPTVSTWAVRGSLAVLILITVGALGSGRIEVGAYGFVPPLRIIGFGIAVALGTQHLVRLMGRYDEDTLAITVEVCIRNVGVGLLLIHFFFPDRPEQGHVLYTCLFYSGMSGALALPSILRHRWGRSAVLLRRAFPKPQSETS